MNENNFIDALNWRYATKSFDTTKKVSEKDFNELTEAARLAPSSFGLQPFKIIVVKDEELRKKLREASWGQAQVTDASHFVVFAARTDLDEEYVNNFIKQVSETRGVSAENLKEYNDMMVNSVNSMPENVRIEWAKKQAYLSLGVLLSACALKRIDACPMEGFDPVKFDEILSLKEDNLTSAVMCAIGYRASDEEVAKYKKVRFSKEDFVLEK